MPTGMQKCRLEFPCLGVSFLSERRSANGLTDFVSYTEGVDTTTPSGRLLFHMVGAVAQFERHLIAEGVRAGIALRRTHATLFQFAGGSLRDAQAQLGHSKMCTTLEVYTLPIPEQHVR
jgi:hypothetical protein